LLTSSMEAGSPRLAESRRERISLEKNVKIGLSLEGRDVNIRDTVKKVKKAMENSVICSAWVTRSTKPWGVGIIELTGVLVRNNHKIHRNFTFPTG
jgi:hypothetical protein